MYRQIEIEVDLFALNLDHTRSKTRPMINSIGRSILK